MEYIKRFIKKLSDNVQEKKSDYSSSTYYRLGDDKIKPFVIRCSDHLAPINKNINNLDIIKAFGNDNFVVLCTKYKVPMIKNRKEVKDFIKFSYDMHCMEEMKKASDKQNAQYDEDVLDHNVQWEDFSKEVKELHMSRPILFKNKTWTHLCQLIHDISNTMLSKEEKAILKGFYNSSKLSYDEVLYVVYNLLKFETFNTINPYIVEQYCLSELEHKKSERKKSK